MTANINSILGLDLVAVNNAQSQTVVNISLQGITLGCTSIFCDQYFQVGTTGTIVPLPTTTVFVAYVRNLGSNLVAVNYTTQGVGTGSTANLCPVTNGFGGVFIFFQTAGTSGGITGISLTAANAITPVEIFTGY